MSCNCGCHDDAPHNAPAVGWRKFVPVIVGVLVVAALIAGAILKSSDQAKTGRGSTHVQAATGSRP